MRWIEYPLKTTVFFPLLYTIATPLAFLSLSFISITTHLPYFPILLHSLVGISSPQALQLSNMETFPSQNSLWAENDDEYAITQCHHCQDRFPARGINRLLPVPIGFLGDRVCEAFLCLDCRRRHFETHKQPYKTAVGAYQYPGFGSDIIPWITESEAKVQYCLDDSHLEPLQNVIIRPVQAAGKVQQIKMFYEKSILDKVRWVFGGDIGIANARVDLALRKGICNLPPEGDVRERRSLIRHLFLEKGFFADPSLGFVKMFVEENQGELDKIVPLYAV